MFGSRSGSRTPYHQVMSLIWYSVPLIWDIVKAPFFLPIISKKLQKKFAASALCLFVFEFLNYWFKAHTPRQGCSNRVGSGEANYERYECFPFVKRVGANTERFINRTVQPTGIETSHDFVPFFLIKPRHVSVLALSGLLLQLPKSPAVFN